MQGVPVWVTRNLGWIVHENKSNVYRMLTALDLIISEFELPRLRNIVQVIDSIRRHPSTGYQQC